MLLKLRHSFGIDVSRHRAVILLNSVALLFSISGDCEFKVIKFGQEILLVLPLVASAFRWGLRFAWYVALQLRCAKLVHVRKPCLL